MSSPSPSSARRSTAEDDRGVVPVLATVLLVAVVLVVAVVVAVVALGILAPGQDPPPTAAFDAENDGDVVRIVHDAGQPIQRENLGVRGGELLNDSTDEFSAGSVIAVDASADEVQLVWYDDENESSFLLERVAVDGATNESGLTEIPPFSRTQYDFFRDTTLSDPFTVEVHATDSNGDPLTGEVQKVEVEVSDHLGSFDQTPENSYYGSVDLNFSADGTATLVLGNGPDVDVYYWGIDVNDITETLQVRIPNNSTTLYLRE